VYCGKIHDSSGYWLYRADPPQPKESKELEIKKQPTHKEIQTKILGQKATVKVRIEQAKVLGV
jgi:hypothetical protein